MMDPIKTNSGRKVRIISGSPIHVEDMLNTLIPEYVIWQWRWDVCEGHHLISVVLLLASDLERAMRMQQIAAGAGGLGRPQ